MKALTSLLLACLLLLSGLPVEAKRLGGGGSVGRQSGMVTQREAARTTPAPTQNAARPADAAAPAGAAAQPQRRPWGAMLGGLAAGLGLAWLANSLGFGEGLSQFLMIALLVFVVMAVFGAVMRRRRGASAPAPSPFALQGASAAPVPATLPQYSADKVGNDASARPWERNSMAFDARATGSLIGSGLTGSQQWGVAPEFDSAGFLNAAKAHFVTLQDAWDRSDIPALRAMMTDDMLDQIKTQLAERDAQATGTPNKTEVVMLDGHLLGIETLGDMYMASVEFSGLIREDVSAGPSPFREVWNMTKPTDGSSGWLVAGVQALQ